jgi:hypothetical protein
VKNWNEKEFARRISKWTNEHFDWMPLEYSGSSFFKAARSNLFVWPPTFRGWRKWRFRLVSPPRRFFPNIFLLSKRTELFLQSERGHPARIRILASRGSRFLFFNF